MTIHSERILKVLIFRFLIAEVVYGKAWNETFDAGK